MRLIAILTDFGLRDHYNGVMKGVIYSINPEAKVVDLVDDAPSFSVLDAAFMLWASYRYFPAETVFLVVVDPGVGTSRAAIAIKTKRYFFIGPDNGVLYPAASADGIEAVVRIKQGRFTLESRSGTFDGRDVFAPVAAWVSKGIAVEDLGDKAEGVVRLEFGSPEIGDGYVVARVIHVDKFGDVVTNVPISTLDSLGPLEINGKPLVVLNSFSECSGICGIKGSSGFLEIASNMANAAEALGLKTGDRLELRMARGKA